MGFDWLEITPCKIAVAAYIFLGCFFGLCVVYADPSNEFSAKIFFSTMATWPKFVFDNFIMV